MPGFAFFNAFPEVADLVETIWDVDIPDPDVTQTITIKVLPTVSPALCVHFRSPTATDRLVNSNHRQRISGIHTSPITLRPRGALGAVIVHLRPEAAARIMGGRMDEFTNTNVGICDLFGPTEASQLEEILMEASGAADRAKRLQAFLARQMRDIPHDAAVRGAVLRLRRDPTVPVRRLACDLDISERQLSRRFQVQVGTNLKQFARIVRMGKAVAARRRGAGWADIAYACGFNDQSHLVNDFKSMAQTTPDAFFRTASCTARQHWNASLAAVSDFSNTFFI